MTGPGSDPEFWCKYYLELFLLKSI